MTMNGHSCWWVSLAVGEPSKPNCSLYFHKYSHYFHYVFFLNLLFSFIIFLNEWNSLVSGQITNLKRKHSENSDYICENIVNNLV